jgi:LysR family glycine cleavage system transcriptional activator
MDRLPPLNPLRAFEAAGRLHSIRRAAEELSVTPGAVSRQVKCLEQYFGVPLFRRDAKEIVLTAEGEQYLVSVSKNLNGIREATQKLTGKRNAETLHIRGYTTFCMKWLIPRLGSFQVENEATEVRLTTSNEAVDFERESLDGAIRLGEGAWPGVDADRLVANEIVPLCSPAFRRQHDIRALDDLHSSHFLHSIFRPDDWRTWLNAVGKTDVDPYGGSKYASSILAYQAAMEGQGIFMAQRAMFVNDLRSRRLVQPFKEHVDLGSFTYYFIYPRRKLSIPAFRKFRLWLLEQAMDAMEPHPELSIPSIHIPA